MILLVAITSEVAPAPREPERHYTFRVLHLTPLKLRVASAAAPRKGRAKGTGRAKKAEASDSEALQATGEQPEKGDKLAERHSFRMPPIASANQPERTLAQLEEPPTLVPENIFKVPEALIWPGKTPPRPFVPPPSVTARKLASIPPAMDLVPPELQTEISRLLATLDIAVPSFPQRFSQQTGAARRGDPGSVADIPSPPGALITGPLMNQLADLKGFGADPRSFGLDRDFGPATGAASLANGTTLTSGQRGLTTAQNGQDRNRQGGPAAGGEPGPASPGAVAGSGELTRITRPPTGRHSIVVFGAAAAESHPESAPVLKGKVVYTVYLQVGLPRNWILLFFQPGAEQKAGVWSRIAPLDPPYPYVIVRPSTKGLAGDYTLVHGVVNTEGRFEQLALVTPEDGVRDQVLEPLLEWEFRPASKDGVATPVEILLIIPHARG